LTAPKQQQRQTPRPSDEVAHPEGPEPTKEENNPSEEETRRFNMMVAKETRRFGETRRFVKMITEVEWDANSVDTDDELHNDL